MKKFYLLALSMLAFAFSFAQTPVPMASQPGLTYTENFADIANWTNGFAAGTGANRFGAVAVNATGTIPDGVRITTATATFATGTSGGVQRGSAQTPATQSIVLLATGATDNSSAVAIDFFMDFTGVNAGTLSFDWASVNNSTGDRKGSLRVYWSTNGTTYTEIPAAAVLNFTNNSPTNGTISTVALPTAFNNSATARLRFYYHNGSGGASGSRPKISVDNLTVTASSGGPATTVSVSAGTQAAEPATNGTFNVNLSSNAPAGGITITYTLGGTAIIGAGNDYTDPQGGSITIPAGSNSGVITLNTIDDNIAEPTKTINITLTGATSPFTISTGSASINLLDEDIPPPASISLTGGIYSQAFNDTLASSGTSTALHRGWLMSEAGTNANNTYDASTGSSTGGNTYSFGAASSSERAFGGLQSGSLIPTIGAFFTNNTGATVTSINITYTGEQWRLGVADRADQLDFQYSLDATSLTTGTWNNVDQLDFISPVTTGSAGALDGNTAPNRTLISYTITGLSIPDGATFYIRWNDFNASGADDGLAVDDFSIETNPTDLNPPVVSSLSPNNGATGVSVNLTASIVFNEAIQKGTGNISVRRTSDNTIVQTTDVTNGAVTISGNTASFPISGLSNGTGYYIEVDNAAFKDLSNNNFAGISGNSTWAFTTGTILYSANFNVCSTTPTEGFTQFSAVGAQVWACTTFGRDAANMPTGSAPNGLQINGFSGTNIPNEDWLISPSFNLTGTTYPLLSFYSRTRFNGAPLQLKVSTDYPGTGDPRNFTWTDLNGKFPAQTSDVWTLSNNINLSAFKAANVHFAFVYFSTDDEGARWTVDDIQLNDSPTPPPASLSTSTTDIQFGFVANGSTSDKTFTFTGNDITTDVTITSTGSFTVSKDGTNFSSSITYTIAEANNIPKTITVRFAPTQSNQNFNGTVTASSSGLDTVVTVRGTSIDPANTLEVVNWNIEWFGSPSNGPTNDATQEANVRTIMQSVGADIYGLGEIVSEARLASVVAGMPGYSYVISNYGSHTNPNSSTPSSLADAQKLAFVYKTSLFSNVSTQALLSVGINSAADVSTTSYNNWASGRFPYMLTADVTLDGITKTIRFVLVHAKANTSPTLTSYNRRKAGADELHALLNSTYANDNIIILGDYNDDLDSTITDGINPKVSSWVTFVNDNTNFAKLTLPLSLSGKKSTVSYNDVIDHVITSNELNPNYMAGTASILTDVTSLVTNYASSTSDHYPVFTRYRFTAQGPLPVNLTYFSAKKKENKVDLDWSTALEVNSKEFVVERSANGRDFTAIGKVASVGNTANQHTYTLTDQKPLTGANFYRLRMVDVDGQSTVSRIIKVVFDKQVVVTFAPNPARTTLTINVLDADEPITIQLLSVQGKTISQRVSPAGNRQPVMFNVASLPRGLYVLKMITSQGTQTEKVMIQ
jgi:hypothetical protein